MAFSSLQGWFVESFRNSEQFWKVALPQQWIQRGLWKVGPWEAELGEISEIGKSSVYCQLGGASLDLEAATCDPDISGSIGGQSHPHPSMHCKAILASMIKKVSWERWSLGKSFIGRGQLIKQGDVSFTPPTVFYQQNVRVAVRASSHLHPELEIVHQVHIYQVHINLVHIYQVHSELFIRCILIQFSRCQLSVCLKTAMSCMATILVFHSRNWHDRVYPNTYCNGYLGLLSVYCDEGYLWLLPSPDSLSSLLSTLLLAFPPNSNMEVLAFLLHQHGGLPKIHQTMLVIAFLGSLVFSWPFS